MDKKSLQLIGLVFLLCPVITHAGGDVDAMQFPEKILFETAVGDVSFPHEVHVSDFGVECGQCHHETAASELNIPHPEYYDDSWGKCETCHQSGVESASPAPCSRCHHDTPMGAADETLSSKVVIHQSCWQCHEVGAGEDASSGCGDCHGDTNEEI